jgi:MFS transporter, CP family, cyanate transporter
VTSHEGSRPPLPLAVLGALFVVSLALRPQLVGLGPLLPQIQQELGVSHAVVGLLTTIPVLCMGIFAPLGPVIAARLGTRRTLAMCVAGIVVFGLLRSAVPGTVAVVATTLGLGLAMGTAGALMSIVVKERASFRPALATGVYATGIVAGSLVAAAAAVPLAQALGGWRAAMAVFSIAAIGSFVGWLALLPPDESAVQGERVSAPALPWRSRLAWGLAAVFGLQSLLYYGTISWLPDVYVERGWSEASAGSLIAVMHLVGLVIGLVVPWAADRVGSRRAQMATVSAVALVGYLGIAVLPDAAWLWAGFLGFGLGAVFPLCLTLPVDIARRPADVGAAAALMLLGGYLVAGLGPVVLGLARDVTGNFGASIWVLVVLSVVLVVACLALTPTRLRRGITPAPAGGVATEPA